MKLSAVQPIRRVAVSRCQCPMRRRGGQRNLSEAQLLATLVQRNSSIERSTADDRQLGRCETVGLCRRIVKMNAPEAHLPDRVCGSARRARLSARQRVNSLRRGRHAHGARQCPDPLGGHSLTATRAASFIRATLHRYSTFEDVCRATSGYGERVERPEDLPAAIERSLTVMRREKHHALLNVIYRL